MPASEEKISVKGNLTITLTNKEGNVIEKREVTNLVVDTGLGWIVDRLNEPPTTDALDSMKIGTGITSAVAGDTDLETSVASVNAMGGFFTFVGVNNKTVTYRGEFGANTPASPEAITEAGIFIDNGDLFCRSVFSAINKGVNDILVIAWDITAG